MMRPLFVSMSDRKMASLIAEAKRRVAVAVPAIRPYTAEALVTAARRIPPQSLAVVMDCDEEVFRLGYGDFEALKTLREAKVPVRQSSGLRIGVLVCDDEAWVFAPTALYVQAEVQSDETPNALALRAADVQRIASRLLPPIPSESKAMLLPTVSPAVTQALEGLPEVLRESIVDAMTATTKQIREEIVMAEIEIGHEAVQQNVLQKTERALEQAPPIAFDVARQVRVFEPYIQYVEISLRGCAIERHRVEVPKAIQGIDPSAELNSRLRTTFELIERSSDVSSKRLEKELNDIRENFTRALGKPWGRVVLRAQRDLFDQRIVVFKQRLAEHKETVERSLAEHLEQSRKQLVEYYLPLVRETPPDVLLGQITVPKPSDEQIRSWLNDELTRVFPEPKDLVTEMKLDVQFRDVTYETLVEEGFGEKLRDAFPRVEWDKPFSEFDAAKARDSNQATDKVSG
jgi:hypothetical protein